MCNKTITLLPLSCVPILKEKSLREQGSAVTQSFSEIHHLKWNKLGFLPLHLSSKLIIRSLNLCIFPPKVIPLRPARLAPPGWQKGILCRARLCTIQEACPPRILCKVTDKCCKVIIRLHTALFFKSLKIITALMMAWEAFRKGLTPDLPPNKSPSNFRSYLKTRVLRIFRNYLQHNQK